MRAALFATMLLLLPLAGCLGDVETPTSPEEDVASAHAGLRPIEASFSGTARATPATPYVEDFTFDVPTGAVGLNATLKWTAPVARMSLTLIDPYGEVVETGYPEQTGVLRVATVDPPASGKWILRVGATAAVDVAYGLDAVAELLVPEDNLVRKTTQLRAGAYHEINVIMEANATFLFTFAASGDITWDVHSHPPGGVKYWQKGVDASYEGSFTAPERGIYSLLFQNAGALPVDITYEMTGAFRLHSHAQ